LMIDSENCRVTSGNGDQNNVSWDGTCNGSPVAVGTYQAILRMPGQTDVRQQISVQNSPVPSHAYAIATTHA